MSAAVLTISNWFGVYGTAFAASSQRAIVSASEQAPEGYFATFVEPRSSATDLTAGKSYGDFLVNSDASLTWRGEILLRPGDGETDPYSIVVSPSGAYAVAFRVDGDFRKSWEIAIVDLRRQRLVLRDIRPNRSGSYYPISATWNRSETSLVLMSTDTPGYYAYDYQLIAFDLRAGRRFVLPEPLSANAAAANFPEHFKGPEVESFFWRTESDVDYLFGYVCSNGPHEWAPTACTVGHVGLYHVRSNVGTGAAITSKLAATFDAPETSVEKRIIDLVKANIEADASESNIAGTSIAHYADALRKFGSSRGLDTGYPLSAEIIQSLLRADAARLQHDDYAKKYGEDIADAIESEQVKVGMTSEQVLTARGPPLEKLTVPPSDELWRYQSDQIIFQGGRVTSAGRDNNHPSRSANDSGSSSIQKGRLINPVVPGAELGPFRHGTYPSLGDKTHVGVDLVASCGSPVFAFADGTIADVINNINDRNFSGGLGYMVLIEHPTKLLGRPFYSLYLHLQEPPVARKGDPVIGGKTEIGKVGRTGRVEDSCHTHFEIRNFSGRLLPAWGNIYGPGDQRNSADFKENWTDPEELFARYPNGLSRQLTGISDPTGDTVIDTTVAGSTPSAASSVKPFDSNMEIPSDPAIRALIADHMSRGEYAVQGCGAFLAKHIKVRDIDILDKQTTENQKLSVLSLIAVGVSDSIRADTGTEAFLCRTGFRGIDQGAGLLRHLALEFHFEKQKNSTWIIKSSNFHFRFDYKPVEVRAVQLRNPLLGNFFLEDMCMQPSQIDDSSKKLCSFVGPQPSPSSDHGTSGQR